MHFIAHLFLLVNNDGAHISYIITPASGLFRRVLLWPYSMSWPGAIRSKFKRYRTPYVTDDKSIKWEENINLSLACDKAKPDPLDDNTNYRDANYI